MKTKVVQHAPGSADTVIVTDKDTETDTVTDTDTITVTVKVTDKDTVAAVTVDIKHWDDPSTNRAGPSISTNMLMS